MAFGVERHGIEQSLMQYENKSSNANGYVGD